MNNQKLLEKYCDLILKYNKIHMLTGFKNKEDIFNYLFLDSIKSFENIDLTNKKLLDVGTGAGIPGVILKIINPSVDLSVIESLNKRVKFLESLNFIDFKIYNQRAENVAKELIEQFDIVTTRAFYNLAISLEILAKYCKVNGLIILIKGKSIDLEIKKSSEIVKKLHLKLIKTTTHKINDLTTKVLIYQKLKATPTIYPRSFAKLKRLRNNH